MDGKGLDEKSKSISDKPLNKRIKFEDSDSSDEDHSVEEADSGNNAEKGETKPSEQQQEVLGTTEIASKDNEEQVETADESAPKKQRVEDPPVSEQTEPKEPTDKPKESTDKPKGSNDKPIDDLIDEDLKELGDRKKVCLLSEFSYSLRYVVRCSCLLCNSPYKIYAKDQTETGAVVVVLYL